MKKTNFLISLLALSILSAGCAGKKSTNSSVQKETDTVENVVVDFESDYEKCRGKDYANLDFSNSTARLPKADSCYSLVITEATGASDNATVENFESCCEYFLGECNHDYFEFRPSGEYTGDIGKADESENALDDSDGSEDTVLEDPKVYDYLDEVKNNPEDFPWLFYRDTENQKYLWWSRGEDFPHWMNKGEAFSLITDNALSVSGAIPTDMDSLVAAYLNGGADNDTTYRLPYGDISVSEAVSYFENEYLDSLPYDFGSNYSLRVHSTEVYELANNNFCYVFKFSTAWKDIPFDWMGEYTSNGNQATPYTVDGEAVMIKKDDVDWYTGLYFPNVVEETPIENICTLESAIDIMSEKLTNEVVFEVQTIGMVYQGNYNEDYTSASLEPVWKFEAYNPNDGLNYSVYVNAVSGDCTYMSYSPAGSASEE